MKLLRATLAASFLLGTQATVAAADPVAANPNILPQGQLVLNYIAALSANSPHRIISGQWASGPAAWPMAYSLFIQDLYYKTGRWVGLFGSDYSPGFSQPASTPQLDPPTATASADLALSRNL